MGLDSDMREKINFVYVLRLPVQEQVNKGTTGEVFTKTCCELTSVEIMKMLHTFLLLAG